MSRGAADRAECRLVNGSTGDPALWVDPPGRDDALLFDAGEIGSIPMDRLGDLGAVFLTHHHVDHFMGFDRVVRANLDRDKALGVFGPEGTIRKVYARIKSYEYPFFPFQKVVVDVHEVLPDRLLRARLECARKFPRPVIEEVAREGPAIYGRKGVTVEATAADHTVPCLAFAMVESPRAEPDLARVAEAGLRPGAWMGRAEALIRESAPESAAIEVGGRSMNLGEARSRFFRAIPGRRVAYVTDTAWSPSSRPGLIALARGAEVLYCDAFYAHEHLRLAETHGHMTARFAAEFAREAGVGSLVLIHFSTRYRNCYEKLVDEARAIFPSTSAEIPATGPA